MRRLALPVLGCVTLLLASCGKYSNDDVVSQKYIHKYGYAVSKNEFEHRRYPGQVVTVLKTGVTVNATYEDGVLHGPTTHTFPNSQTVEAYFLYNEGQLIKQVFYNLHGMPLREEIQLSPTRFSSTRWYHDGIPMSIEEYSTTELVEGQYFTPQNDIEARVEKGRGIRLVRDPQGVLKSREEVDQGTIVKRDTFYSNGTPETVAFFLHNLLHGEKRSFTEQGEPLAIREYVRGKLHGKTTFFKNGVKTTEVHYLDDMKNGLEVHYLDGNAISQEILWENDRKHGPCKYYTEDGVYTEYFYEGELVSDHKWKELNNLDQKIGLL